MNEEKRLDLPTLGMSVSDLLTALPKHVSNILPMIRPYLSPEGARMFERELHSSTPELFQFSRLLEAEPTEADFVDFADRLNKVAKILDGTAKVGPFAPFVGASLLSSVLMIPHQRGYMVIAYLFVYDLPMWADVFVGDPDPVYNLRNIERKFDAPGARVVLNKLLDGVFVVGLQGEFPTNA